MEWESVSQKEEKEMEDQRFELQKLKKKKQFKTLFKDDKDEYRQLFQWMHDLKRAEPKLDKSPEIKKKARLIKDIFVDKVE